MKFLLTEEVTALSPVLCEALEAMGHEVVALADDGEVPLDPSEPTFRIDLARRVFALRAALRDRTTEAETLRAKLAGAAICDTLTGLKNRRHFREALTQGFAFAIRQKLPLSLVILDLDLFKSYNDTYGQASGDAALIAVGDTLRLNLREYDLTARSDGDEFTIMLPATDEEAAWRCCDRLRAAIESHPWPLRSITASLGIATTSPHTLNPAQLRDEAGRAILGAKERGRNRSTHFHELVSLALS